MAVTIGYRTAEAEGAWKAALRSAVDAWRTAERRSVAVGVRRCGLDSIAAGRLPEFSRWALENDLHATVLGTQAPADGYSARVRPGEGAFRVAYGRELAHVRELATAYDRRDERAIGALLGFPHCCVESFCLWWPTGRTAPDFGSGEVDGFSPSTNILLRHSGARAVPHLPCSLDCGASERIADEILAVLTRRERDDLLAVLSLPVRYSVRDAVAVAETDGFRISSDADGEPAIDLRLLRPLHAVDGFPTHAAMTAAHDAVVGALPPAHAGLLFRRSVVDLACGSGRLARLTAERLGTESFGGIDASERNVAVARRRYASGKWSAGEALEFRRRDPDELVLIAADRIPLGLVGPAVVHARTGPVDAVAARPYALYVANGAPVAASAAELGARIGTAGEGGEESAFRRPTAAGREGASRRPRRRAGLEEYPQPLEEWLVLYRRDRGEAHSLNAPAQAVWQLCDGRRTVRQISAELENVLGSQKPNGIDFDVEAAIEALTERGLLEPD